MPSQAERIGMAMRKEVERQLKALALDIDRELRKETPVDTGHARRNWVPSIAQPHADEVDDDSAHAAGVAEVLAYKLADGALWVANSVPYINALNYGHSKQRPAGWVERAVDLALQNAQKRAGAGVDVSAVRAAFVSEVGAQGAENLASAYSPLGGDS
jgi:hypothetical protein